jgi:hypothetical protein
MRFDSRVSRRAAIGGFTALAAASQLPPRGASAAPAQKRERVLSIDVNAAADGDYEAAFNLARGAGLQQIGLTFHWSDIETAPGVYNDENPTIANLFYPAYSTPLFLALAPISTNADVRPADLQGLPWDDPAVIDRFLALIDHLDGLMPDVELTALLFGLEVDALLGEDADQWNAYAALCRTAGDRVRALRPDTRIGVETLLTGRVDSPARFAPVDEITDFAAISYYPLSADYQVRSAEEIRDDVAAGMEALPDDQPVLINQLGCPSSEKNRSSNARQAEFVGQVFELWDEYSDRVELIRFTWLHDRSPQEVAEFSSFYGIDSDAFTGYLGSLGLRTSEGDDKPAFVALARNAHDRGW